MPCSRLDRSCQGARGSARPSALTDAIIDRLGQFEHIVVRPTRALQPYENTPNGPIDIGQSLKVDAVIEPRVHQTPEGLTVSAQLVRSSDGVRLWSGHFEHAARRPEVYEQVGRGRAYLLSASLVEMPKAEAAFRAAVELDPTYAAAHAGLALACCAQAECRTAPVAVSYEKAKAAALRALAMNDACADAQVALGTAPFDLPFDRSRAWRRGRRCRCVTRGRGSSDLAPGCSSPRRTPASGRQHDQRRRRT